MEDEIPVGFWKDGVRTPSGYTVGDLVKILRKLPADLPINKNHNDEIDEPTFFVNVYNVNDETKINVQVNEDDLFGA